MWADPVPKLIIWRQIEIFYYIPITPKDSYPERVSFYIKTSKTQFL